MSELKDPVFVPEEVDYWQANQPPKEQLFALGSGMAKELQPERPPQGETPVVAYVVTTSNPNMAEGIADTFSIIDLRSGNKTPTGEIMYQGYAFRSEVAFLVTSNNVDFAHGKGYKGIRQNEGEVVFGRYDQATMKPDDYRSRFESNLGTSRSHFSVEYNGNTLNIRDKGSTNGTLIKAEVQSVKSSERQPEALENEKQQALRTLQEFFNGNIDKQANSTPRAKQLLNIASKIIAETDDPGVIDEIVDISTKEMLNNIPITPDLGEWNVYQQFDKRIKVLDIYNENPELARLIVAERVAGFHGSRSGSLWGVIEHDGLLSAAEARSKGQILASGERTYSQESGQDAISFADFRFPETIRHYARSKIIPRTVEDLKREYSEVVAAKEEAIRQWGPRHPFAYNSALVAKDIQEQINFVQNNPHSVEAELMLANFPVAYGVSIDQYEIVPTMNEKKSGVLVDRVPSDIPGEFQIIDTKVPLDRMPIIAVPKQYISRVRELLQNKGKTNIKVVDIDLISRNPIER